MSVGFLNYPLLLQEVSSIPAFFPQSFLLTFNPGSLKYRLSRSVDLKNGVGYVGGRRKEVAPGGVSSLLGGFDPHPHSTRGG